MVLITGAWYTQTNIQNETLNSEIDYLNAELQKIEESQKSTISKTDKYSAKEIYKGDDIERLEKQVEKLEHQYNAKKTNLEDVEKTVSEYINGRYTFSGTLKSNVNNIIGKVKEYITDDMLSSLKELSKAPIGNMGASDNFNHTAEILDIYFTEIEQPDTNNNDSGQDLDNLPHYLSAIVKLKMNNSYTAYDKCDLVYTENDTWLIFGEEIVSDDIQYQE